MSASAAVPPSRREAPRPLSNAGEGMLTVFRCENMASCPVLFSPSNSSIANVGLLPPLFLGRFLCTCALPISPLFADANLLPRGAPESSSFEARTSARSKSRASGDHVAVEMTSLTPTTSSATRSGNSSSGGGGGGRAGAGPEAVPEWKSSTATDAVDGAGGGGCVDLDDYDPNVEVDDSPAPSLQAVPTDRRKVMISRMFKFFFLLQALMMVDSGLLPASLVRVTEETGMGLAEQGWMGGIVYLGITASSLFAGSLLSRWDQRRVRSTWRIGGRARIPTCNAYQTTCRHTLLVLSS
jgi:hypothetical protein